MTKSNLKRPNVNDNAIFAECNLPIASLDFSLHDALTHAACGRMRIILNNSCFECLADQSTSWNVLPGFSRAISKINEVLCT